MGNTTGELEYALKDIYVTGIGPSHFQVIGSILLRVANADASVVKLPQYCRPHIYHGLLSDSGNVVGAND